MVKNHTRAIHLDNLKKTPLNQFHKSSGARMVPFGGWEMPVQYTSIINEHITTRTKAGLFDVSHMGEIFVEGKKDKVLSFLEHLTPNRIDKMQDGQVQYNAILNQNGGLVDDVTIYKFNDTKYMICSNASNFEKVFVHLNNFPSEVVIRNESPDWHQIAIQGPFAEEITKKYLSRDLSEIRYYRFVIMPYKGEEIIISRTGYTGEDGFEIYTSNASGLEIWNGLLDIGKPFGLTPVGLGARDTLRLEAKYPLYGHELNAERTPVESGIGWIVKEKETKFLSYDKIIAQKNNGTSKCIIGLKLIDTGVIRDHFLVYDQNSNLIGEITSGSFSPTLKESIGLAYIDVKQTEDGTPVFIDIRGEKKKAIIINKRFIHGSVKK